LCVDWRDEGNCVWTGVTRVIVCGLA